MHRRRRYYFLRFVDRYRASLQYFEDGDAFFLTLAILLIAGTATLAVLAA